MAKKSLLTGILLAVLAAVLGCSASAPKEIVLYWPAPPEEPRIAYVASYRGQIDVIEITLLNRLLGVGPTDNLLKPYSVAASGGKIYVSDSAKGEVAVLEPAAHGFSTLGKDGRVKLGMPMGVATAADGTVFVSDVSGKKIVVYDGRGEVKGFIGKPGDFENNVGVAFNEALDRLYVTDSKAHRVSVFNRKGEPLFKFGGVGREDGQFYFPAGIAIDRRNGNVAVADTQNFRVQVFDKDGTFLRKFGQLGDTLGSFTRPRGVAIDSEGHIYVSDSGFDNFQIFDEQTRLMMAVGSAGTAPGMFQLPAGMYIDEQDRIYVVDQLNSRVQVFQYLSEKWKKEHPEEYKKYLFPQGL